MFVGVAAASLAGAIVGYLGFRFSLAGVYFALLTIAFGEFTRIAFDHWSWAGGSGGLFLKVDGTASLLNLRGGPVLFYYVILALAVGALVLSRVLLESRLGRYWLAIREDAEAAQAVGVPVLRCKMIAVVISAALTSLAGVSGTPSITTTSFPRRRSRWAARSRSPWRRSSAGWAPCSARSSAPSC